MLNRRPRFRPRDEMGVAGNRLEATLPSPALDVRHGSGVLRCTVAVCDVELQHIFQFGPRRCAGAFDALQMWVAVSRAARYHAPDSTHATKKVNTNGLAITQRCKYGSSWHVAFHRLESILATSSHLFPFSSRTGWLSVGQRRRSPKWHDTLRLACCEAAEVW